MKFNKNVRIRNEKFGAVIFETLKEKVFVTNSTGADIISLLQENKTKDEITKELATAYNTTEERVAFEVSAFIDELCRQEVLI